MMGLKVLEALPKNLNDKYLRLQQIIKAHKRVLIGFSGGVDSGLLAKVAHITLDDNALAVIGVSPSYPKREEEQAIGLAKEIGISYKLVETEEMDVEEYRKNQGDRCYYCKKELYSRLSIIKKEHNYNTILDGTNYSDLKDIRPGLKAVEELDVQKPLVEAKITKEEVRFIAKSLSLSNWDKPSFACLSSRFPDGTLITIDSLSIVEKGEQLLYDLGFRQFRLRYYHDLARIELLEEDFKKMIDPPIREKVIDDLTQIGFQYITLDLKGYRKENHS